MPGRPKLIVLSEQLRGKSFELTKDLHTVGRSEERDICVKDPTISTYHCDFIKTGNTYTIRDNNSTNGTRVNNVPVTEQELQNSDILQLGGVEILFDCDDKSVTTVMKTHTGITLDSTDIGMSTVKKMNNVSPFSKGKGSGKSQKIVLALVIFLIVVILFLMILLFFMIRKQTPGPAFWMLPF
jgi:pSer/pThr/pTyr-binding forkhead associated (FHA) protein